MKEPFIELLPGEIGLEGEDMTATANTDYDGNVLDLRGYKTLSIHVVVSDSGNGSAGAASLRYQRYDKSGTAVGAEIDLLTAIVTYGATTTNAAIRLGDGASEEVVGGTAGTNDGMAVPFGRGRLTLRVTTQSDATTSTASVTIYAQ